MHDKKEINEEVIYIVITSIEIEFNVEFTHIIFFLLNPNRSRAQMK